MRVLLLVEGPSDETALRILAQRVVPRSVGVNSRMVGKGDLLDRSKVRVHVRLSHRTNRDITKVVLCVDSEHVPTTNTAERIDGVVRAVQPEFRALRLFGVVIDRSPEGWMLMDRDAIASHLGMGRHRPRYSYLELLDVVRGHPPAHIIGQVFSQSGREFRKTADLPSLAAMVNLEALTQSSLTFNKFVEVLRA